LSLAFFLFFFSKVNGVSVLQGIDLKNMSLANVVALQAEMQPLLQVLRFVHVDQGGVLVSETRNYAELWSKASALAAIIKERQPDQIGNIALMMNNHPEFVETMVASSILGVPFVPIDPRAKGLKLAYMLAHTDCEGLVCADYCLDQVLEVLGEDVKLKWILCVTSKELALNGNVIGATKIEHYQQLLNNATSWLPSAANSSDSPMFMMFTSGTTGNPKAVVYSQGQYMAQADSLAKLGANEHDVFYTGLSLTHINAQNFLRNGLALGIPVVISRKFSKSRLWDICREYGCTMFSLLGGMIPEIYAVPEKPDDAKNPVKLILSSGMPVSIWADFERRFGVRLFEVYGATEGGGLANPPGIGPVGSIGKPSADWEAEIFDSQGVACKPGVEGEICFRRLNGQATTVSYYKNEGASAEKVQGGWLRMGDLGHKDENGWFYFHHRVGGGVRRNGDFVNTSLVDATLLKSSYVQDVFVYGVATPKSVAGEKTLVAAIVLADDCDYSEAALRNFCSENLEKNDIPEIFQVLSAIPKTVSEKPIEKECIALLDLG
tara:strand:+ start:2170 stop:3816 length:1647 start_codon:yes stop_codon:yes gene_type:complete